MRRLENEDDDKFWEAWIKNDLIFCYRFGKLGSSGHTKIKKFKTRAEAEAELEQKLAEKIEEGFSEIGVEEEEDAVEETDSADEAEEDEAEENEAGDDEAGDDEAGDDEGEPEEDEPNDDEDEDEDEDEQAEEEVAAAPPKPAEPELPVRFRTTSPNAADFSRAEARLEAVVSAVGKRSWKLARTARLARRALERLGGSENAALTAALDRVLGLVIAPKIRSPSGTPSGCSLKSSPVGSCEPSVAGAPRCFRHRRLPPLAPWQRWRIRFPMPSSRSKPDLRSQIAPSTPMRGVVALPT